MVKEILEELSPEEFDKLIKDFIYRGDDKIELSTFLKVMAALEEKRKQQVVELSGELVNGEVIFDVPSSLPVNTNEIYVGDMKIVLKLRATM